MPDLEALQHRLEAFRAAGQNLQLDPLVTRKALAKLGVEYQTDLIDELEQAVEDCAAEDNKLVFTGHRGCGKSIVRRVDRQPDQAVVEVFEEVLRRRLPLELVEPQIRQQMILKSGGVLRELIRLADRCCDKAMKEIRRQIRRSQFDELPVIIDQRIWEEVLTDLQIAYAEPLGQVDFAMLKGIYEQQKPQDTENQRFLDLLHGLYVLEYRDKVQWYDLSPIVYDMLVQEGVLNEPNPG